MPVLVLLAALADPRLSFTPHLELAAGYDDNLFLNPDIVGVPTGPISDGILHVAPRLPAALVWPNGHAFLFAYDLIWHEPLSGNLGAIADHLISIGYRAPELETPLVPIVLHAEVLGERYDATFTSSGTIFNYDAFWLGGVEGGAAAVGSSGRLGTSYRFALREYSNRDQQDREQRVDFGGELNTGTHVFLGGGYAFTYVASTASIVDGAKRHRFAPNLRLDRGEFAVRIESALTFQTLPNFLPAARDDLIYELTATGSMRINDVVDLFLRLDLMRASSSDATDMMPGTGSFTRNQVIMGFAGHMAFSKATSGETPEAPSQSFAPRRMPDGRTRFRVKAPGARTVAVVGDWNAWDPTQGGLASTGEDDTWQADLTLSPGGYNYAFLVDGETVRPPDAESYVPDGFGGQNGHLEVTP